MGPGQQILAGWIALMSAAAFALFGFDKWRAGRSGGARGRVAESVLCWVGALGGWPGGLLGLLVFRHKSAKGSFQLKFALALAGFAAWVWGALELLARAG